MIDKFSRLLVIHHNRLFRQCLISVLSKATGTMAAQAISESDFAHYEQVTPTDRHMVLIDSDLPGDCAIDLTRRIRHDWIDSRVIVLAAASSQERLVDCIAAGAHGCIAADESIEELENAIERVRCGETFCSADIVQSVFVQFAKLARETHWRQRIKSFDLTPREIEILQLISDNFSNKQIAKRLTVSLYTVKNHVHNILEKLQVSSRFEAVGYAQTHRIVNVRSRVADPPR